MPRILILLAILASMSIATAAEAAQPKYIRAPEGFQKAYQRQFTLYTHICELDPEWTGPQDDWVPAYRKLYRQTLKRFNRQRTHLNIRLNRAGLGFAPSLDDWKNFNAFLTDPKRGIVYSPPC